MRARRAVALALAATIVFGVVVIDRQSLWLDELGTWRLTVAGSWAAWFAQLGHQTRMNVQLLFYHLYMRSWVTVFPVSEWWLRASNLPWLFVAAFALLRAPVAQAYRPLARMLAATVLVHPLVAYYANEARPYAMLLAGACLAGSGVLPCLLDTPDPTGRAGADRMLWIGLTILVCASPIGLVWAPAFLFPRMAAGRTRPGVPGRTARRDVVLAIACVTATLLAIAWDLGTTLRGIAVTTTPSHPLESFAFAFYEIAGIAGIGPGREDLRRLGAASLAPFAGLIATWGLVLGGLATAGVVRLLRRNTPSAAIVLAGVLLPLGILLALAETAHWRVVGRHLLPLVWWFAYAVAWGVTRRPGSPQPGVSWPLAGAAFVLLTVSSLQIAFAARHEREDYRGASRAALARDHAGDVVWWVASPFGPEYYGRDEPVRRGGSTEADRFLVLLNPAAGGLDSLPAPALVALSRGETFDEHGAVARYVRTNGYRPDGSLRGFELWWCPGAPTP